MTYPTRRRRRGMSLVELVVIVIVIAILAMMAVPNFIEPWSRSAVSRAQADQRSMATALASYYVDHGAYPFAVVAGWSATKVSNDRREPFAILAAPASIPAPSRQVGSETMKLHEQRPTFAISSIDPETPGGFASLTTPIQYITSYFNDPFSPYGALTFTYLPDGPGFLLASFQVRDAKKNGPNGLSTLARTMRWQFTHRQATPFDGKAVAMSKALLRVGVGYGNLAYTYDPTNGSYSSGAVYRTSD